MQGGVKGGFVSRSSLCSSLVDGGGCWLTELSMVGLEGSMRSIIFSPSFVCVGELGRAVWERVRFLDFSRFVVGVFRARS